MKFKNSVFFAVIVGRPAAPRIVDVTETSAVVLSPVYRNVTYIVQVFFY